MSVNIFQNNALKKIAGNYVIDSSLSTTSKNAVQNKVITSAINGINSKVGTGTLDVGSDCVSGINTLNTHLFAIPTIESGSVAVSNITAGELRYIDVTFTKTFATVPNIILTEKGVFGDQTFGEVSASKTGFRLFTKNDANQTVSYALNWVAVS